MIWRIFYYASAESEIERKRIVEADTIERAIEILIENEYHFFGFTAECDYELCNTFTQ